jgi:CBS domain-containing protein
MKVSDILKIKGNVIYSVDVQDEMSKAIAIMAQKDIGSVVVMEYDELVGMLTFREVIECVVNHPSQFASMHVRTAMDDSPLTCTPETALDEVRRMMLEHHARYMPVVSQNTLLGLISFYDVAKTVVDSQNFENTLLKAYIRDWPEENGVSGMARKE